MVAHVFIDNSNIFHGAQRAASRREPAAHRLAIRIHYRYLFNAVEDGREVSTRMLAGSVPPGNEALWRNAQEQGYNTDLLRKVERDDGKIGEQGVDELLHLKIANSLLDFPAPQTLVLVTGDGKDADYGTSFPRQVERALRLNWQVEVWSWKEQLSPNFSRQTRPGKPVKLRHLDDVYKNVVFVQGGRYRDKNKIIDVVGRSAEPIDPGLLKSVG